MVNNKFKAQTSLRSLIRAFYIGLLEVSYHNLLVTSKISIFELVTVAEKTVWFEICFVRNPKDRFCCVG